MVGPSAAVSPYLPQKRCSCFQVIYPLKEIYPDSGELPLLSSCLLTSVALPCAHWKRSLEAAGFRPGLIL